MKDKFNLQFWQNDYAERFQLNREGRDILKGLFLIVQKRQKNL